MFLLTLSNENHGFCYSHPDLPTGDQSNTSPAKMLGEWCLENPHRWPYCLRTIVHMLPHPAGNLSSLFLQGIHHCLASSGCSINVSIKSLRKGCSQLYVFFCLCDSLWIARSWSLCITCLQRWSFPSQFSLSPFAIMFMTFMHWSLRSVQYSNE